MIFNSIRWRLQAWHGLILIGVLAGFGMTAYRVAQDNQLRAIDTELERQMEVTLRPRPQDLPAAPGLGTAPGRSYPSGMREMLRRGVERAAPVDGSHPDAVYFIVWERGGTALARSANAPPDVPPPDEPRVSVPEGSRADGPPALAAATGRTRGSIREIVRRLPTGDVLMAGRAIDTAQAAMRRLRLWLAAAGAGVLLLGLAGGGWLASRAIRPIDDISVTAQRIAAGDLGQRINAADMASELGSLAGVLNSTFARLETTFAQQARFTADASHELRTPVAVILSETQMSLARERSAADYRDSLAVCQRAAGRMRQLIESLLELSRLDARHEPMRQEPFDLAQVVRESLDLVRPLAAERRITMHADLPRVPCVGDAGRIGQVATNLLSNAIQFNRDGGDVRISTRLCEGHAALTVADSGEGIPAPHLPHVFERFYRVDASRSRATGRSGLGLAICKAIVDAHHGTIEAESHPGAGSEITVRLPAAPRSEQPERQPHGVRTVQGDS